ncbi:tRNA pseudouridine(55) synthase TruB, partial [Candidatus Woesebacteria bacterium RBG_16_34_12]
MYLLIDKPKGITSHDVVDELRKITGIKRIGHAGTLDPNATGLLIVGVGRSATKELGKITKNTEKTYLAEIYLGEERDTDDAEGKILRFASLTQDDNSGVPIIPSLSKVKIVLHKFIGEQEQVPPVYSAIKIKGRKAYELARRSISLSLSPRKIIIYKIKLLEYKFPILKIETVVSSGTYIRALAR